MKVGARKLRGKAATKKATKKAMAIKTVQTLRDGFKKPSKTNPYPYYRYLNTSISDIANEKFPEMVMITAGPSKFRELFGKRYVNPTFAQIAIDTIHGDCIVDKGRRGVENELAGIGIYQGVETALPTDGHSLVETLI